MECGFEELADVFVVRPGSGLLDRGRLGLDDGRQSIQKLAHLRRERTLDLPAHRRKRASERRACHARHHRPAHVKRAELDE
jgi:hypothetical protein